MSGDNDLASGEVETTETSVLGRIPDEDAWGGARLKFMSGVKARKTEAAKYKKMVIGQVMTIKALVRGVIGDGHGWENIEEMGSNVKGFSPKGGWKMRVEKKCAHHIINGVVHAFGATILLRGMWA